MSKQAALDLLSGSTVTATPSLIAPVPVDASQIPTQPTSMVTEPVKAEVDKTQSDHFAALAKKEAKLEREREETKKQRELYESRNKKWDEFEKMKETDLIEAVKMMGLSDTDIFNAISGAQPKELTIEERAAKAANDVLAKDRELRDQETKAAKEALDKTTLENFKNKINKTIETNLDKFELVNFNGAAGRELVYETVIETLKTSGELLPISEAAEMVEKYYEDTWRDGMKLKKFQPKEEIPTEVTPEQPQRTITRSKTLTNEARPTIASTIQKQESRADKRARLEEALRTGKVLF